MKRVKSHFKIEQQNIFRIPNRARQTVVLMVTVVCLTGLLPSPGYSQNQNAASHPTTSSAANGGWTFTGDLITPRSAHTATLLVEGKVLVTGGYGYGALNSTELFDPSTGSWSYRAGALRDGRSFHTATLLKNGQGPGRGRGR